MKGLDEGILNAKFYARAIEIIRRLRKKYPQASKLYDIEAVANKPDKAYCLKKRVQFDEIGEFDNCYELSTDRLVLFWENSVSSRIKWRKIAP